MSVTDELLKNNETYAQVFDPAELPLPPAKRLAKSVYSVAGGIDAWAVDIDPSVKRY